MKRLRETLWTNWKKFARLLGRIQVLVILTLLYLVVFVPSGLLHNAARLISWKPKASGWRPYRSVADPKNYFRRQG